MNILISHPVDTSQLKNMVDKLNVNLVSESAVESKTVLSFLKILCLAVAVHVNEEPLSKLASAKLRTWNSEAQDFLTRFAIRKPTFARIVQGIMGTTKAPEDDLDMLADILKSKIAQFEKETDISKAQLQILKYFVSIAKRGSATAITNLNKSIMTLGDPILAGMFTHENQIVQSDVIKNLEAFCRKAFKKGVSELTVEDKEKLRAKNPEQYKQFLKLSREINQAVKDEVRSFVRASGDKVVTVSSVLAHLKKKKIQNKIPTFNGYIDELGALYNSNKVKLNGSVTGRIELNPAYDAKTDNTYIFLHYPLFGNGQPQRIYTMAYKKSATADKFDVVDNLIKQLPKMQKRWRQDLKGPLSEQDTVCSLILEIIYITSGRIGTASGATGISSLLCKEYLNRAEKSFTLSYTGKKGVKQKHVVPLDTAVTKHIHKMLNLLKDDQDPNEFLMRFGPRGRRVTGSMVNNYIRAIGGPEGATAHNFRHMRGTLLTKEILAKHPFGKGRNAKESEVNKWVLEALKKVGEKLGHMNGDKVTATTAIQNYINPQILKDWFAALGVRPNNAIQTAIDKATKDKD